MSDELQTAGSDLGAPSQGEAQPTTAKQQERQPVDLTKLDEFRSYQSERDRKEAERQNYYQQQLQAQAQNSAALQQQIHQIRMQGMDESQQLAYQNQILQQQLSDLARQRELDQYAFTKMRDLEEISRKTNVPFDKLKEFNNSHEAWSYALDEMSKQPTTKKAAKEQDAETPDAVDLGSGKSVSAETKYYNEWKEAKTKDFDMGKMLAAEEKALRAGVDINKWR